MTQCPDGGDTAWLMAATTLVLQMGPGLAIFESGLVRKGAVLSVLVQVFAGMAVLDLLWFLFGFSLVFGPDHGGVIGDGSFALFLHLRNTCQWGSPGLPSLLYAIFQMQFASITPLLITGAFAERLRTLGYLVFVVVWWMLVYLPVAHWIWGGGWLHRLGAVDFAGGVVIHTTAGVAALVCAVVLGRRHDFERHHGEPPAHSLPMATVGAALLIAGWMGFNGGSAFAAGMLSIHAMTNSLLAGAASTVTWIVLSMIRHRKKIDPLLIINAWVVGLAGITPASGYVDTWASFPIGVVLALCSALAVWLIKGKLKIDDALDVSAIHGVPGAVGAILIGFFATSEVNPSVPYGLFYGGSARLLGVQAAAVAATALWTVLITVPLIWTLKRFNWAILQRHHTRLGLDWKDFGQRAYNEEDLPFGGAAAVAAMQMND